MVRFIDDHRATYGVEPICSVLPIAPSTYFRQHAHQLDATQRSVRARRDGDLRVEIRRVWDAHFQVYGPRKVWRQLQREGVDVARCTVVRLMREMGLAGAVRGRAWVTTTQSQPALDRPADLVDRTFTATLSVIM
jgi:putative transposase